MIQCISFFLITIVNGKSINQKLKLPTYLHVLAATCTPTNEYRRCAQNFPNISWLKKNELRRAHKHRLHQLLSIPSSFMEGELNIGHSMGVRKKKQLNDGTEENKWNFNDRLCENIKFPTIDKQEATSIYIACTERKVLAFISMRTFGPTSLGFQLTLASWKIERGTSP